jgi:mono/diheme cytochrome c family protein
MTRSAALGTAAAATTALTWAVLAGSPTGAAEGELDPVARGEQVFHIGGCTNCHTAKNGQPLAGGDAIASPFGDFYPPNITPDPETGIGGWSEADFIRAMREGVGPDGAPYYPAFPYTSYTRMTDDDLKALKAYLGTVASVRQESRPHALRFPFNQRWGMRIWQRLFFTPQRFEPDPSKDAAWNRGAYLVQGPGHCAECHTPRTSYGVLEVDRAFAGAQLGKEKVPNITSDPEKGIGKWSEDDIATVLKLGMTPTGDFVGSDMAKVVKNDTSPLPDEDVQAIATYIKSLPPRR